jgi:TRAP-type C4-dicarboxylate transport system substrate-binding protein
VRSKAFRLVILLAALLMVFALVGCDDGETAAATTATVGATTTTTAPPAATAFAGSLDDLEYYEFSLSMHDPAASNNGMFYQAWADAILTATDGHVKVVLHPSAQLASAADVGERVETGPVDIGWVFTSFYRGQFPLTNVTTIPLAGFGDAVASTNTLWDLYERYPELQAEWENYKLLCLYGDPGMLFCSADKPIEKPEDLQGLVMRTPAGPITDLVTSLGASPVVLAPPDIYDALEKKDITAYVFEPTDITNFGLQEVTRYFLDMPLYDGAFGLVMNWDRWNSLPPEFQKIIEGTTGKTGSLAAAQDFSDAAAKAHTTIADAGGGWLTPTPEAAAAFQAAADSVSAGWPATIKLQGFDTAAYMQDAITIAKGYSK